MSRRCCNNCRLSLLGNKFAVFSECGDADPVRGPPNTDGSYTLHFNTSGAINNMDVVERWIGLFRCYLPKSVDKVLEFKAEVMKALPKVIK